MTVRPSRPQDFFTGIAFLVRGIGMYARSPGLILLGMLPALIAFAVLVTCFVLVVSFLGPESRALTWFASGWSAGSRDLVRALAAVAVVGLGLYFAVVFYAALTLLIGDPFYEKISQKVDDRLGGGSGAANPPFWREALRSGGDALRMGLFSAVIGVLLFVGGLLPGVGQTVVPVIGALVGGWALAIELTGIPFARRGVRRLRERRRTLGRYRWLTLGFGVAVFVCFLIPFGAVLFMPAAVIGGTLLTRHVHGVPTA
jgi:CysZ protein